MKPPKNIIDEAIRYIGIACVVMMTVVSAIVYAFTNFESKESHNKFEGTVEKRLDRIEYKVDQILEKEN